MYWLTMSPYCPLRCKNSIPFFHQQLESSPFMQEQNFTRSMFKPEPVAFRQQPVLFKQEAVPVAFKKEPDENLFILATLATLPSPPPEQPIPQPLIVSNTDFPGTYGFDLGFEEEKGPVTKSVRWTYSPDLQKLFVKMRYIVPIRLKLKG